jgi:hypothetical protein
MVEPSSSRGWREAVAAAVVTGEQLLGSHSIEWLGPPGGGGEAGLARGRPELVGEAVGATLTQTLAGQGSCVWAQSSTPAWFHRWGDRVAGGGHLGSGGLAGGGRRWPWHDGRGAGDIIAMGFAGACERERERGEVRFDQIGSIGLTTGSNHWGQF